MKKILTLTLLTLLTFHLYAQSDSLYNSLEKLLELTEYRRVLTKVEQHLNQHDVPDSVFAKLYNFRARAFERMGNYDSVFYSYQSTLKRKPDDLVSLVYLASAYGDGGYYYEMAQLFYQLKSYHPTQHVWATNMSYYLNEGGYFEQAKNYADTSLLLAKDSVWQGVAYNNRSYANLKLGNLEQAKSDIEQAFLLYPNNSFAFRNNALILLQEGDTINACEALYKAKELGGLAITEELIKQHCE